MTGHNSNRVWALSLPKLKQVENECRGANTSKARQFKTCGQHKTLGMGPPLADISAARLSWCCSAVLRPAKQV